VCIFICASAHSEGRVGCCSCQVGPPHNGQVRLDAELHANLSVMNTRPLAGVVWNSSFIITLKMEEVSSSETLPTIYQTARFPNLHNGIPQIATMFKIFSKILIPLLFILRGTLHKSMAGRGWPPTQRPSYLIGSTDSKITGIRKPGNKVQNCPTGKISRSLF